MLLVCWLSSFYVVLLLAPTTNNHATFYSDPLYISKGFADGCPHGYTISFGFHISFFSYLLIYIMIIIECMCFSGCSDFEDMYVEGKKFCVLLFCCFGLEIKG